MFSSAKGTMAWQKVSITAQLKDSEVAVTVLRRVSGVASADKLLTKRGPQPLTRLDAVVHLLRADSLQVQQEAARVLGLFAQAGTDATNLIKQSASLTWSMKAALAVQLSSSTTAVRREAVNTLAQLAEHCTSIFELQQEDGVVAGLHALLDDDAVQHLAAGVLGRLAQSRSGNLAQIAGTSGVIEGLAALLSSRSTDTQLAAARALASLAEASSARQRLEEDPDIRKGLSELCRSSVLTVQQASQEALQRITGVQSSSQTAAGNPATFADENATPAAPSPSDSGGDAVAKGAAGRDQTKQGSSGPSGKLATAADLVRWAEVAAKAAPGVGGIIANTMKPLHVFLSVVEQARENGAKVKSLEQRTLDLANLLMSLYEELRLCEGGLDDQNLRLLELQLKVLEGALQKAGEVANKWTSSGSGKTTFLNFGRRIAQCNVDKADIKDAENSINKAVLDLNSILAAVNCFQQLRGNAELKELLAAAQQVQSQVTANSEEFKQYMRAVMQFFMDLKQDQAALLKAVHVNRPARGDSELLKRRFILDSSSVTWEKQPVGHGGSACVYPGFFHGHPVVVKILHMSVDEQQQAEMCKEAAVLSRLQHPCIVRFWGVVPVQQSKALPAALQVSKDSVHDSAGSGGAGWIRSGSSSSSVQSLGLVMDRCDDSLEERLKMGPIPLSKALHVAERIACGLKYLHTDASAPIRVVHGDLKPANVLIKHDEVLLTDFGLSTTIAVHTMSMGAGRLFGDGVQAGGSLAWAAPELLEEWGKGGSPQPTFACDIYAFGILLQQLLVGKRPYVGMPPDALTGGVRSGRRPDWGNWEEDRGSEAGADVLGKLSRLVEACWAHSPGERPTAHEVHRQLVQVKKQLGPAAAP